MLKFIFGRPSSGKTYQVLNMIKALADKGQQSILIVPEQFSFESERAVLKTVGDKASLNVSVMSFSRLCDEVGRSIGGIAGTVLSNADKVIFMNRALSTVETELKLWGKYCHSVYFAKTMLDTIGEFKINAITPEALKKTAEETESESLKAKLYDIALIYETYDALTGEQFIDPADSLTKLYRQLEGYRFFENKTVFIDSFKGFTGQQFKIIDRISAQAENVIISLTNDPELSRNYNVFTNIRKAAERIKKSAARFKITEDTPLILSESRAVKKSLSSLERLLAGGEFDTTENDGGITVCSAFNATDEVQFTARTIRKLVREEGYRYRDFVIIARETEAYEESVISALKQNGIPLFGDKREPLSAFPVAVAVNSAMECALRKNTESILRFHKTGLGSLSYDEISKLENYTLLWNIDGGMWSADWDMNPKGFVLEEDKKTDTDELLKINNLRKTALAPLEVFSKEFNGTASDMARAIVKLLEGLNVADKLALISNNFKNEGAEFRSDILKQSYEKYMKLLDSLAVCFGVREIKRQEFIEALSLAVSLESVGAIPRMLDEVTFGAADRIRPSRPKVAFILGANQGVFPKDVTSTGILSIADRQRLIDLGVEIPDNRISSVIDENYLVYCNLCCPSDRLYITYSESAFTGMPIEVSPFVEQIIKNLDVNKAVEPEYNLNEHNLPETAESAYAQYCRRLAYNNGDAKLLKTALKGTSEEKRIEYLENSISLAPYSLTEETAEKLFGSTIQMSASKFDTYHKCKFYFFCKYGLSAKKLQPAEFDVLQRGTIVHYVLEKIIEGYKKNVADLTQEQIDSLVEKYINEYLDGVRGYRTVETKRAEFLVTRISRALKEVVAQISREFAQSDFEPTACELKIGNGEDIPELKIPFDKGEISLIGSIDRVDEWNGYIRIVDYKTGTKAFKLPDVLFGLNMQMLLYLYAVIRGRNLPDEQSAGILYMPSKRDLNDSGMAMNGLIRLESEIVSAMDKEMQGEFVPKLDLKKDGTLKSTCTSFVGADDFTEIFDYIESLMKKTGKDILSGDIRISPLDGRDTPACKYCDYSSVCLRENAPCERVEALKNDDIISKMREVKENGI